MSKETILGAVLAAAMMLGMVGAASASTVTLSVEAAPPGINEAGFDACIFGNPSLGCDAAYGLYSGAAGGIETDREHHFTVGDIRAIVGDRFAIGIDSNTDFTAINMGDLQWLTKFELWNTDTNTLIFVVDVPFELDPALAQANGFTDFIINGYDLAGLSDGTNVYFRLSMIGLSNGSEQFYFVDAPEPVDPVYVDAVMASDPLLYWSFEETPLDSAQDRITQLATNVLVPQQGATRAPSMPGLGSAASFAGTRDNQQTQPRFLGGSLSIGGPNVFDHYAVEMWVKLNDASGFQYLLEGSDGVTYNSPAVIHGFSSNGGQPALEYFSGVRTGEMGPTTLNDNQWHHVVFEVDVAAGTHTIYIDGQMAVQASGANPWRLPYLSVGATAYWDGFQGTNGLIDELAFYDLSSGPATGARVASHYYVMFPVAGTPPAAQAPSRSVLHPAVPNPFNPSTTIRFDLPRAGAVDLAIYDVAGRRVRTLVRESIPAGSHEVLWNGVDDNGRQVASGAYLYRLEAGSYVETRRMTLVK